MSLRLTASACVYTWPADVKASDDWLPAQTFLIMKPCRASTTLGLYTRFVSPCPSLPVIKKHLSNPKSIFVHFLNSRSQVCSLCKAAYHYHLLQKTKQFDRPVPQRWCESFRRPPDPPHWCPSPEWACYDCDCHCVLYNRQTDKNLDRKRNPLQGSGILATVWEVISYWMKYINTHTAVI